MASFGDEIRRRWSTGGMLVRLIMVNLAVFLLIITLRIISNLGGIPSIGSGPTGAYYLAFLADPNAILYRPWTIITHMFTHQGVMHIVFNMIFLWFLGRMFQEYFGPRKLLATYLLGGLSGFAAFYLSMFLIPGLQNGAPVLGASAAVMAIFIGFATYFPDREIRLILIGAVKLKYVALVYILLDYVALSGSTNVGGSIGHLGGALYGFLLMRNMKNGRDIGLWFENLLDRLVNLGKGGPNLKVKFSRKEESRVPKSDEDYNAEKKDRQRKIDRILDKISKSGYDSLTQDEKDFLFRNSQDL